MTKHCKRCNAVLETETFSAHEHSYGYEITLIQATCTSDGEKGIVCEHCNAVYDTETVPASGHYNDALNDYWNDADSTLIDYSGCGDVLTTMPTCTENGKIVFICEKCGQVMRSYDLEATGHYSAALNDYLTDAYSVTVDYCGWTNVETTMPTCTKNGRVVFNCDKCGQTTRSYNVEATGHDEGVWKIDFEATPDHDGQMTRYCSICDAALETKSFSLHEHSYGYEKIIREATCTTDGEKGIFCSKCGCVYDVQAIAAKGHVKGYTKIIEQPTCTQKGSEGTFCATCGCLYDVQPVDAKGHIDSDNNGRCDVCFRRMSGGEHCALCGAVHSCYGIGKLVYAYHYILHIVIKIIRTAAPFLNVLFY